MYDLENVITSHLQNVRFPASTSINAYSGHVDGEEKYRLFLTGLNAAGYSFSTRTSLGDSKSKGRIFFKKNATTKSQYEVSIPFFGSPFQVVKSAHLQCAQGEKYFKSRAFEAVNQGLPNLSATKKQRCPKRSKKFGCPAFLSMKCIRVFDEPQYTLSTSGSHAMAKISDLIQENIFKKSPMPTSFLRFLIVLSPSEAHTHPVSTATLSQPLHPELKDKIKRLVHDNITCVKTVKLELFHLVEGMFHESNIPRPESENKTFYPTDKMIRNHIQLTQFEIKKSRFDETDLEKCVDSWRSEYPEDGIFFRPSRAGPNDPNEVGQSTIVFCHQTQWQRDLLRRYGNNVCLLDPVYKTAKYSLPLFFIVVKTNCGYSVVGTFVIQDETTALISEALSLFAAWNPDWEPKYFMTDFAEAEINAVRENFPRSTLYICVFHREQTWDRWLQKGGHVSSSYQQAVKKLWRDVATSISEEEYQANLFLLNSNEVYKQCPLAKHYFTQKWLACHESWVLAYHASEFLSTLNVNNGMEAQKKILKHSFLRFSSNKTAPGILRIIVEEFLPESLRNYCVGNLRINPTLEELDGGTFPFLRDKTKPFVAHFRGESNKALANYDIDKIIDMSGNESEGLFYVKSEREECYYIVDFQTATCSCSHFTKWQFPCKHMCALFLYTDWSFERLPTEYRDSPYVTVDDKYSDAMETSQIYALDCEVPASTQDVDIGPTTDNESGSVEISEPHADLLEARERLKKVLCYTYRMDSAHPSTVDFCRRVGELEAETSQSLGRLEKVATSVQSVANPTNIKMPPLQLLRKKYTEVPAWKKSSEPLKALGRVVSVTDNPPHGLCYQIDIALPVETVQSDIQIQNLV